MFLQDVDIEDLAWCYKLRVVEEDTGRDVIDGSILLYTVENFGQIRCDPTSVVLTRRSSLGDMSE